MITGYVSRQQDDDTQMFSDQLSLPSLYQTINYIGFTDYNTWDDYALIDNMLNNAMVSLSGMVEAITGY